MVYQEKCGVIVMLSDLKEFGMEVCHKYWPSGKSYFQDLTVKLEQETENESQRKRKFTVFPTLDEHNNKLQVTQIQVLKWTADGQCANYDALVKMVENVRSSTILVHCR